MKPRRSVDPWAFVLPTLVLLSLFVLVPVAGAIAMSFQRSDMLTPPVYVGLQNYRQLLASGELVGVASRSVFFSAIVVVLSVSVGLALALLLEGRGALRAFVRSAVFSAYVVSWVSVALLFLYVLDPDTGPVARVLAWFGVRSWALLTDPDRALPTLALVMTWKLAGYSMVCFLVGLGDIPPAVVDAARLDGARPWARFVYVVLPMLRPTISFVATTSLIVSFQAFDIVRIMTQGGPVKATTLFVYAIYEHIFLDLRVGRASALAVVFFVLLFTLSAFGLHFGRVKRRR